MVNYQSDSLTEPRFFSSYVHVRADKKNVFLVNFILISTMVRKNRWVVFMHRVVLQITRLI